ncbi:MAG: hypothetical protein A2X05_07885 [Bacteroidetes bacterium GWE2_41_25]|nr:MAG: hypothetical protein A2X06_17100 [Bacteroidetes bacterium GWC2_40_22]OFY00468.1 MAG: hypothetical protein A2X05_07885 [Bacteroidetes bacterium GWE2_41_25]OFY60920.1 MAG: hypothetical protein A2X04_09505 [Bacteroidetes bacterium GWF2_41_9]HBQ82368.1 hypothetical protein [Bacteroidales bacterium]
MKKTYLIIVSVLFLSGIIRAQNLDDALRYSQVFYSGTARFNSMGGAFTALGADLSSLSQNPAGLGVFRSSELSLTPQLNYIRSTTDFSGITTDYLYNFSLNQGGFVSNIISKEGTTGLISLNFGYSFNKTNNLNQNVMVSGINNSSSIADSWAGYSEGTFYSDLEGAEGIAYDAWIIDTITGSGGNSYGTVFSNYGDNPPSRYGHDVRRSTIYDGYLGEHAMSFGGNYSNKIYFGATFGINTLRYSSYFEHVETANSSMPSEFKSMDYIDYFEDRGTGFTFKFGLIARPVEMLRIGVAFHTPTYYKIDEYFYEDISSKFTDGGSYQAHNEPLRFNYALNTPFRFLSGVALQIQKFGVISADYEYVDYSAAYFFQTGDGYNYSDKNNDIREAYKATSNFRVGGEFRYNKFYLRSGYGYYGKAFKPAEENADLDYRTISGGLGFREKAVALDFGYVNYKSSQKNYLYQLDSGFDPADYNTTTLKDIFSLTLSYKFGL